MAKYFEVKLPCKPHIAKYVGAIYGTTLKADRSNPLSLYITANLEKKMYENRHFGESFLYKFYTAELKIQLNRWQFHAIGYELSRESIININKFVEEDFELDLYKFCKLYTTFKPDSTGRNNGYKEAINYFAEMHHIRLDYDISFYGLQRKELRFRQKMADLELKNQLSGLKFLLPVCQYK